MRRPCLPGALNTRTDDPVKAVVEPPGGDLAEVVEWLERAGLGGMRMLHLSDVAEQAPVLLARIADAHARDGIGGGSGLCTECEQVWPCPTWRWATGRADPAGPWNQ